MQKTKYFWVSTTRCWWVQLKISTNILLCVLGELAGGGSEIVAVGVSDMWQVTGDIQHVTCDTWHVKPGGKFEIFKNCISAPIPPRWEIKCFPYAENCCCWIAFSIKMAPGIIGSYCWIRIILWKYVTRVWLVCSQGKARVLPVCSQSVARVLPEFGKC